MKINSTQQNASRETDICTVIRGLLCVIWDTKFHYRVVTMLPMAPDLSKTNQFQILPHTPERFILILSPIYA